MPRHALSDADARTCHNCNRFHDKSRQKRRGYATRTPSSVGKSPYPCPAVPGMATGGHSLRVFPCDIETICPNLHLQNHPLPALGRSQGGGVHCAASACYFTKLAMEAAIVPNEANEVA